MRPKKKHAIQSDSSLLRIYDIVYDHFVATKSFNVVIWKLMQMHTCPRVIYTENAHAVYV